jgi:hypothetical protein
MRVWIVFIYLSKEREDLRNTLRFREGEDENSSSLSGTNIESKWLKKFLLLFPYRATYRSVKDGQT